MKTHLSGYQTDPIKDHGVWINLIPCGFPVLMWTHHLLHSPFELQGTISFFEFKSVQICFINGMSLPVEKQS